MTTVTRAGYTPEQLTDAEKILKAYDKVPADKKSVFVAMFGAFVSGMETQERLEAASQAAQPLVK